MAYEKMDENQHTAYACSDTDRSIGSLRKG
jgi:hypothetical protein